MKRQEITRNGKRFVMVPVEEFRRLERLAEKGEELPPLPAADEQGNRPAVAYARASIARDIVKERREAGLSQQELARRAGVRQETISRIESGKHSPTVSTLEKIERALQKALKKVRAASADN